jgi:L-rhamnose mutarotase
MKRFALTCMLKDEPGIIEKYENYHAHPWPEVIKGSYACGVRRTFIYRIEHRLFMFFEAVDDFDLERDVPKYMEAGGPKAKEWDELMRTFQTNVPEAPPGTTWVPLTEIYALDRTKG